jgi:hypothetical protein
MSRSTSQGEMEREHEILEVASQTLHVSEIGSTLLKAATLPYNRCGSGKGDSLFEVREKECLEGAWCVSPRPPGGKTIFLLFHPLLIASNPSMPHIAPIFLPKQSEIC